MLSCPPLLSLVDCCFDFVSPVIRFSCHSSWLLEPINAPHNGAADDYSVSTATSCFFSFTGPCSSCCRCLPFCTTVSPMLPCLNYCYCCVTAAVTARFILLPWYQFWSLAVSSWHCHHGWTVPQSWQCSWHIRCHCWLIVAFYMPTTVIVPVVVIACSIVMQAGTASTAASSHCFLPLVIVS